MIKRKKLWTVILLICIAMSIMPVGVTAEDNYCGENITWMIDDSGVLTISGTGDMVNFVSLNHVPWNYLRDSITYVDIQKGVTSIGSYAFSDCIALENVSLPESIISVGKEAFFNCEAVKNIYIQDLAAWCAVDFFDYYSNPLYYAENLYLNNEAVTELFIPEGVASVGKFAFCNFNSVKSVSFSDDVTEIGAEAFYNCDKLSNVEIGNSIEVIGERAFSDCGSIKELFIPDNVIKMGESTFYNCDKLESVIIGGGIEEIEKSAFEYCPALSNVTIGDNVEIIGDFSFYNCDSLKSITIPESVIKIGSSAFRFCDALEGVFIPESVNEIGSCAFASCKSLKSIDVSENNQNYCSENGVLFDKDKTKLIKCPAAKANESYIISETVVAIDVSAFSGCDELKSIAIPNNVTQILNYAFEFCSSITEITIGENVKSIGHSVFLGCDSLAGITVNANNAYYCSKNGVLYNNEKSELIKYPAAKKDSTFELLHTIKMIEEDAFKNCTALEKVYYAGTTAEWNSIKKDNCKLSPDVQIVYSPSFTLDIKKENDLLLVTPNHREIADKSNIWIATYKDNGNRLVEVVPATVGTEATLSAKDIEFIKAFVFYENMSPAFENIIKIIEKPKETENLPDEV